MFYCPRETDCGTKGADRELVHQRISRGVGIARYLIQVIFEEFASGDQYIGGDRRRTLYGFGATFDPRRNED